MTTVDCSCGNPRASWCGPDGSREFACDACYVAGHERLGETCVDGGKCHHACKSHCFRRACCGHFSDYSGPWAYKPPFRGLKESR